MGLWFEFQQSKVSSTVFIIVIGTEMIHLSTLNIVLDDSYVGKQPVVLKKSFAG